jgi:AraC-like DNA-binding protein
MGAGQRTIVTFVHGRLSSLHVFHGFVEAPCRVRGAGCPRMGRKRHESSDAQNIDYPIRVGAAYGRRSAGADGGHRAATHPGHPDRALEVRARGKRSANRGRAAGVARAAGRPVSGHRTKAGPAPAVLRPARRPRRVLRDARRRGRAASVRAAAETPALQARRWIDDHPAATSSIAEIAELVQLHPRTLRRQFLKEVGESIQEYRRRTRARYAEELLRSRTDTVDVIAALVGVKSRSTFYRLLKRWSHGHDKRSR